MSVIYIISVILLICSFLKFKKSESEKSILESITLSIVLVMGLNILIGTFLGLMHVKCSFVVYIAINFILSIIFILKARKDGTNQDYTFKKVDIAFLIFAILITTFIVGFNRQFFDGAMKFGTTDSAIHTRAAMEYKQNFDLLSNLEEKTAYDFNYMQPGAYINDGLLMKVLSSFGVKDYYTYEIFETIVFFIHIMLFLCLIRRFIDENTNKTKLFMMLVLGVMYVYGYIYDAYLLGFSYLNVGLLFVLAIVIILNEKNYYFKNYKMFMIALLSYGLIFSYSLFVPVIFTYVVVRFFFDEEKGKRLNLSFGVFLLLMLTITLVGASYILIPTLVNPNIEALSSAISNYGYVPKVLVVDYIYYIPILAMGIITFIIDFKKGNKGRFLPFIILSILFYIVMKVCNRYELVSNYYLSKTYYFLWIACYYTLMYSIYSMDVPRVTDILFVYVVAIAILIILTIFIKGYGVSTDAKRNEFPNFAGMYYYENSSRREFVDRRYTFSTDEIALAEHTKEIEDMTVDNTLIVSINNYHIYWVWTIGEFEKSKNTTDLFVDFSDYSETSLEEVEKNCKYVIILPHEVDFDVSIFDRSFETIYESGDYSILKHK